MKNLIMFLFAIVILSGCANKQAREQLDAIGGEIRVCEYDIFGNGIKITEMQTAIDEITASVERVSTVGGFNYNEAQNQQFAIWYGLRLITLRLNTMAGVVGEYDYSVESEIVDKEIEKYNESETQ